MGGASHSYSVAVRKRSAAERDEMTVFITFETPPSMIWRDSGSLVVVVNGVNTINKSLRKAEGTNIIYRLQASLTEEAIRSQLDAEQKRMTELLHGKADAINANARQRYEAFIRWAKENTERN
jgi:hypothetical protein